MCRRREEAAAAVDELIEAITTLEKANCEPHEDDERPRTRDLHARLGAAGDGRRAQGRDKLERMVADDLWPLPRYSEMLFIK